MLNVANDIAREQPISVEGHQELQADVTGVSAPAEISSHALDQFRQAHANQWANYILLNTNLDPVAQTEQNITSNAGDVSVTSDVTRSLNGQAQYNANLTAQQLIQMGFSPEAVSRAQELVRHHSVSAGGDTQVAQEQGQAQSIDPRSAQQQQPQQAIEQPVEMEQVLADLEAAVDQDSSIPAVDAASVSEARAVEEKTEIQDPLEGSRYMVEIDAQPEMSEAVAQENGLTVDAATERDELRAEISAATADRLDLGFASMTSEMEMRRQPEALAQQEDALRFDLQIDPATSQEMTRGIPKPQAERQRSTDDELLHPELMRTASGRTVEQERAEPFKLSNSDDLNTQRREGRARVGVYSVAA